MSKVRRNDPCPCGSGKKYKHCCQRSLTTTKMKQMVEISRHLEGLAKFAFDNFHEDMGKQTRNFIQQFNVDKEQVETYANLMVCWLIFHSSVRNGKTPVELYLMEQKEKEEHQVYEVVKKWQNTTPSLYTVQEQLNRNVYKLKDYFTDQEYTVEIHSESLPEVQSLLAGSLIVTGEHCEFYIDYAKIPVSPSNLSKKLQILHSEQLTMKDDFPHVLHILLSNEPADPVNDSVLALLKNTASSEIYEKALPLWVQWNNSQKLTIRKEQLFAAALHYYVSKHLLEQGASQAETAASYDISASSLSAKYRQLKTIIQ
ncbi:SEC-C motif-containing protein [Fictibacillus solisalsi]|uniref:SEC-C motif-containing protein n=1 Tax=Fictibacillus solisalsi TaxID=459525 RepID=A0A1G9U919_9BACL|nr:SEC-C domain-containing protein [Fictibacillus solisalsi]SDM56398.1 SEC-C motif-containing protein [Fictibacillus solisalsi]